MLDGHLIYISYLVIITIHLELATRANNAHEFFFCIVAATHFHFFFVWQSVAVVCIHFIWHSKIVSSAFKVVSREKKRIT